MKRCSRVLRSPLRHTGSLLTCAVMGFRSTPSQLAEWVGDVAPTEIESSVPWMSPGEDALLHAQAVVDCVRICTGGCGDSNRIRSGGRGVT